MLTLLIYSLFDQGKDGALVDVGISPVDSIQGGLCGLNLAGADEPDGGLGPQPASEQDNAGDGPLASEWDDVGVGVVAGSQTVQDSRKKQDSRELDEVGDRCEPASKLQWRDFRGVQWADDQPSTNWQAVQCLASGENSEGAIGG